MRKILLLLLLPLGCFAQSSKMSNPSGAIISISPGTTITQNSPETEVFRDTIKANTLNPNRYYNFMIVGALTTPLLNFPGLTVKIKYGSQTYTLTNAATTVGNVNNGLFTIEGSLVAQTSNSQFAFAKVIQPGGSLISLSSSNYTPTFTFTNDYTQSLPIVITVQFTGTGLGTSSLSVRWVMRDAY